MDKHHEFSTMVQQKLVSLIQEVDSMRKLFVVNPEKDFIRKRKISFVDVILFLLNATGGSLQKELINYYYGYGEIPNKSAMFQQRVKVLPVVFQYLYEAFTSFIVRVLPPKKAFGYRILAVDGTSINIARNPADYETYIENGDKKGYNQVHLTTIHDVLNNIYIDSVLQPGNKKHEREALYLMLDRYPDSAPDSIATIDRGFEGYNSIAHLQKSPLKFILRVKDITSNGILSTFKLPNEAFDQNISTILTRKQGKEFKNKDKYTILTSEKPFDYIDAAHPFYPISFRVVRFQLPTGKYESVVTNLPEEFTPEMISVLYSSRWGVETSYERIKDRMDLEAFHAKKRLCIEQEIWSKLTMFNFTASIVSYIDITPDLEAKVKELNYINDVESQPEETVTNTGNEPVDTKKSNEEEVNNKSKGKKKGKKKKLKYKYKINFATSVTLCRLYFEEGFKVLRPNPSPTDLIAELKRFKVPIRDERYYERLLRVKRARAFNNRAS